MGIANKTHWVGVFLLFASSILLLITTISAPIINDVGLLDVTLTNGTTTKHSSVRFGTFGYCVLNAEDGNDGHAWCTRREIGYSVAHEIARLDSSSIDVIERGTSDSLTNVFVLHPVECGIAFIAFLLSCGAGVIGSFAGALVAFVAWVLVIVSLAVDFTVFGIIHHHVNDDRAGGHAYYGSGMWCLVASFVTLFLGMLIVFFTCCANRREKKRSRAVKETEAKSPPRKKKFGIF